MIYHDQRIAEETQYSLSTGSAYDTLDDLQYTVDQTVEALVLHRDEFDSIIVHGMSGVLVGAPVSLALKKPLVVLRKEGERAHSADQQFINKKRIGKRTLWLDDFVCMGETRDRVYEAVHHFTNADVTHEYLYSEGILSPGETKQADTAVPSALAASIAAGIHAGILEL